ncbi:TPA: hypothetical protein ACH3X1_000562 [Trebouxia sp. C0004]
MLNLARVAYAGVMAAEQRVNAEKAVRELLAECGWWSDDMTRRLVFRDGLPTGVGSESLELVVKQEGPQEIPDQAG